jgi:hypothetical protein
MKAKYYIYRNLRKKNAFSVRYRGKVMMSEPRIIAINVEFRVSEAGRNRVLRKKQKNVHAFVVADECYTCYPTKDVESLPQIRYNPYEANVFTVNGQPITKAKHVVFENGKCWLLYP